MLVDIADLVARLPFTMNEDEEREANGALEDLSIDAQAYGSALWVDPTSTPLAVKNLILRAAARHMKNYEGYTASKAGDEQVQWADQDTPGTATFSEAERNMIATLGGKSKFIGGVGVVAWGKAQRKIGKVPTTVGNPFPLFADEQEPW